MKPPPLDFDVASAGTPKKRRHTVSGDALAEHGPSKLLSAAVAVLAAIAIFVLLYAVWHRFIRPYFFPFGDDISLIVNSTPLFHPRFSVWFLEGFKNYFNVYPDLFVPYTNFIRPVFNAAYYADYIAFGRHWSMYLLPTYAFVGAISGLTVFIARRTLKLGWGLALLAAVCVAAAPSLAGAAFFFPVDGFDLLAGVWVLSGLLALLSDALLSAWIFFALAAFTKETALFAPFAAAFAVYLRKADKPAFQRRLASVSFLAQVVAWAALYWHDFRGKSGIYALAPLSAVHAHAWLVRLKQPIYWPIAAVNRKMYWDSPHVALRAAFAISVAFNVVTWLVALFGAFLLIRAGIRYANRLRFGDKIDMRPPSVAVIAIFCAGSFALPSALQSPNRLLGVFYPLFVLCLAYMAQRSRHLFLRVYSVLTIAAIGVVGCALLYSNVAYDLPAYKTMWAMSADYFNILSSSDSPRVFTFDDISGGYAGIDSVQRFSGYKGQLIRLDDLTWNFTCRGNVQDTISGTTGGQWSLTSTVPESCGEHNLDGVFLYDWTAPKVEFQRRIAGATLKYRLVPHSDPSNPALDFGRLDILMNIAQSKGAILVPDFADRRYNQVKLDGASGPGK